MNRHQTENEASSGTSALDDGLGEPCLICKKPVPDYVAEICCSGYKYGCRGQPQNPCVCSDLCEDALYDNVRLDYDARRIKAGIPLWMPNNQVEGAEGCLQPQAPSRTPG